MKVSITHIDTACMLIDVNGFKMLTDPTLDRAGKLYHHGYGAVSRKTDNPAIDLHELEKVDLVLLSHHQHKDNFDVLGRSITEKAGHVISTTHAARVIKNVTGLENWQSTTLRDERIQWVKITATPAQHRPWWIPEFVSGKVIGFILEFAEQQDKVIYISGDTVYFKGIAEIGRRYNIGIGIFHLGGVQIRYLTGFGNYTLNSLDLRKAIAVTNPDTVIPVHYRGWTHFKESETTMRRNITGDFANRSKVQILLPGTPAEFTL
jgi:L-ascorbate metabolism protein UlaG (beta-lactamase superfamily)